MNFNVVKINTFILLIKLYLSVKATNVKFIYFSYWMGKRIKKLNICKYIVIGNNKV